MSFCSAGEKLIGMVTKLESRMLHFLSTMLTDPPLLIKDIVSKTVKPHTYQAMKTNKISFIQPLIFKWKHFLVCIWHITETNL